jgi:hypothetical protein
VPRRCRPWACSRLPIPMQRLEQVAPAAPEHEQRPAIGIERQHRLHLGRQPIEAAAQVGEPARQIHPGGRRQHHGAASAARMRCNAAPSTSEPKRSRTPDGNSTSIPPDIVRDAATGGEDGGDTVSWTDPDKAAGLVSKILEEATTATMVLGLMQSSVKEGPGARPLAGPGRAQPSLPLPCSDLCAFLRIRRTRPWFRLIAFREEHEP